jgi:hypothetical protein
LARQRSASRTKKTAQVTAPEAREKQQITAADVQRVEAPSFYASTIQVTLAGNDCIIVFTRPHPAVKPDGGHASVAISEPVAIINLSMASVKDLSVLLAGLIKNYEAENGAIETPFTKRRKAQEEAKTSRKH